MRIRTSLLAFVLSALLLASAGAATARAQLGNHDAPEWIRRLETPERLAGLKADQVMARLQLKPGMTIAEIGAGSGVFTPRFGKAVGPSGKVYAEDIDQALLDHINERAKQDGLSNIRTVLGKYDDPALPAKDVDMAFIHDVLHHIEHRQAYLKTLATYIKPGGMVTIIDMDPNDPNSPHHNDPTLQVSREEGDKWMAEAGFRPAKVNSDLFPGTKWFVIYQRR